MEKYGTYMIFQNTETNEIKRVPYTDIKQVELFKTAHINKWKELESEPEDAKEI